MGRTTRFKRIYIEITSACNLNCSFCQETLRKPHFMSVSEFSHVIEEVKPYTNFIYLHVKGEPLLHPELDQILSICREANMTVNLTTNGTLLADRLELLLANPVHQINISLHSAEDNDCIEMQPYISQLFSSCETLLANTQTEISLRLWNTQGDAALFGQRNLNVKEHLSLNVQSPFEWPSLDNAYENDRGFCQGMRLHLAILCDGTVVPCCLDGNGVMNLGNILYTPFSQILDSERSQQIIHGFQAKRAVEPLCMHCSFKERFSNKI